MHARQAALPGSAWQRVARIVTGLVAAVALFLVGSPLSATAPPFPSAAAAPAPAAPRGPEQSHQALPSNSATLDADGFVARTSAPPVLDVSLEPPHGSLLQVADKADRVRMRFRARVAGCDFGDATSATGCMVRFRLTYCVKPAVDLGAWGPTGVDLDRLDPGTHVLEAYVVDGTTGTRRLALPAHNGSEARAAAYAESTGAAPFDFAYPDARSVFDLLPHPVDVTPYGYAVEAPVEQGAGGMHGGEEDSGGGGGDVGGRSEGDGSAGSRDGGASGVGDMGDAAADAAATSPQPRGRVCFVGSTAVDGQKHIWTQQVARLPHLRDAALRVDAEYITFSPGGGPLLKVADDLGIGITTVPLALPAHLPADVIGNFARHALQALEAAGYSVEAVAPDWARELWESITGALSGCSVVVFGNNRDDADLMLVAAARVVGAAGTVQDTPNLFPMSRDVSVVVAPSHFAAHHTAVALGFGTEHLDKGTSPELLPPLPTSPDQIDVASMVSPATASAALRLPWVPPVAVINPGVEVETFAIPEAEVERTRARRRRMPSATTTTDEAHAGQGTQVVGKRVAVVGRVSPEKSLGLVVRVAARVQALLPHTRFTIVGDGPTLQPLEALAAHVAGQRDGRGGGGVAAAADFVEFHGPVYDRVALARLLAQFDVSLCVAMLRETLGIANVEAMANELPVVAFANGGQGEYLAHNVTGLVLSEASVEAVADAIVHLLTNPQHAARLAAAGRRLVLRRFGVDHMVRRYARLYACIDACARVASHGGGGGGGAHASRECIAAACDVLQ